MIKSGNKILLKQLFIGILAFFIMFLPRRLYFFGAFSYRIVILFVFVFCLLLKRGKISIPNALINTPVIIYFVLAEMISFTHLQFSTGIGYFIDTVLVLILMYNLIQTEWDFNLFIDVFLLFLLIYSVLGIIECFTGFNIWDLINSAGMKRFRYGLYRSYGSSTNFTNNAAFLMLCLPIAGWKLQQEKIHKRKYAVIFGAVLLNILATLTRSIILCTMILNFIWLIKLGLLKFIKRHLVPIFAAIAVLVIFFHIPSVSDFLKQFTAMFIALFDEDTANEISSSFGSNAGGVGQRWLLYSWIYEAVKDKIIFGLGPNHLFEYAWKTSTGKRMIKTSIENQYLIHLYRYGIAGLISYLLMIISFLSGLWKNKEREEGKQLTFGFMILTTMAIYFISGLSFAAADDFRMLFLLLAIFFIYCKQIVKTEPVYNEGEHLNGEIYHEH